VGLLSFLAAVTPPATAQQRSMASRIEHAEKDPRIGSLFTGIMAAGATAR